MPCSVSSSFARIVPYLAHFSHASAFSGHRLRLSSFSVLTLRYVFGSVLKQDLVSTAVWKCTRTWPASFCRPSALQQYLPKHWDFAALRFVLKLVIPTRALALPSGLLKLGTGPFEVV